MVGGDQLLEIMWSQPIGTGVKRGIFEGALSPVSARTIESGLKDLSKPATDLLGLSNPIEIALAASILESHWDEMSRFEVSSARDHLLRRIAEGKTQHLYVSLFGDPDSAANQVIAERARQLAVARPAAQPARRPFLRRGVGTRVALSFLLPVPGCRTPVRVNIPVV